MTPARRAGVALVAVCLLITGGGVSSAVLWTGSTSNSANNVGAASTFSRCYSDDVISDAPISYWRLNESTDTSAADTRGANPGTYVGSPALASSGALADSALKAVTFNGTSQYVEIADANTLDTADSTTLEMWVKRSTLGTLQVLLDKGAGSYRLQFTTANTLELTKAGTAIVASTITISDTTQFHHLVATKTGATTKLYIDGVDRTGTVTNQTLVNSANSLRIAAASPTTASYAAAVIDEVAVYGAALTAARVSAHYAGGRCASDEPRLDGPVARWRLGEAGGPVAFDDIGSAHGVYNGSVTRAQPGAIKNDSNGAITLDGTSGYVEVPNTATINPGIWSTEAWAYVTGGAGTNRSVVGNRNENNSAPVMGYNLYAGANERWRLVVADTDGYNRPSDGGVVMYNTWTHLVVTFDGTIVRWYVNGVQGGTLDFPMSSVAPNTLNPLRIGAGANEAAPGFFFPGRIDDVAVYDSALSAARVSAHYLSARSYRDVVRDTDPTPLGYWRLGETSGTTAVNVMGTNNGSYVNSPVLTAPGALAGDSDTGVSLNGTSQYVNVADSASLDTGNSFAVEFWIKRNATGRIEHLVSKGAATWGIRFNASNYVELWRNFRNGGYSTYLMATSTIPISDTTSWHHIHVSKNEGNLMLYIDGVDRLGAVDPYILFDSTSALRFGAETPTAAAYASAIIDEVALWSTSLSGAQVKLHHDAGRDAPR